MNKWCIWHPLDLHCLEKINVQYLFVFFSLHWHSIWGFFIILVKTTLRTIMLGIETAAMQFFSRGEKLGLTPNTIWKHENVQPRTKVWYLSDRKLLRGDIKDKQGFCLNLSNGILVEVRPAWLGVNWGCGGWIDIEGDSG